MRDGSPVFLDWDHSLLAHPLCGLVSTLRVFVRHLGAEPGGPEVLRVRDAYLEPWTTFAPSTELRRIFPIASALGDLCRAVLWERKLALLPAAVREKHDFNIDRRVSDFAAALDAPDMLGA
jgi:hypothetical protein